MISGIEIMNNPVRFWVSGQSAFSICPRSFLIQQTKVELEPEPESESLEDRLWQRVLENEEENPYLKNFIIEQKK